MDNSIIESIEKTEKILDSKCAKYKGVAGMEEFVKFLEDPRVDLLAEGLTETVTEDWIKSVHTDIEFKNATISVWQAICRPKTRRSGKNAENSSSAPAAFRRKCSKTIPEHYLINPDPLSQELNHLAIGVSMPPKNPIVYIQTHHNSTGHNHLRPEYAWEN